MKIGVDIDGVLNNIGEFMRLNGTYYDYEKYNGTGLKNPFGYLMQELFGWEYSQDREFWNEYFIPLIQDAPVKEKSSEILHKLKDEGHEIYIITSRYEEEMPKHAEKSLKDYIEEWLCKNDIPYDVLNFGTEPKLDVCKRYNIDVMIDDAKENVLEISKHIPVLCFYELYNVDVKGENIVHVYNWYDIYLKINEMEKN